MKVYSKVVLTALIVVLAQYGMIYGFRFMDSQSDAAFLAGIVLIITTVFSAFGLLYVIYFKRRKNAVKESGNAIATGGAMRP